jgi:hypothetical protein
MALAALDGPDDPAVLGVLYVRAPDSEKPALSDLDRTEAMTMDDLATLFAPADQI